MEEQYQFVELPLDERDREHAFAFLGEHPRVEGTEREQVWRTKVLPHLINIDRPAASRVEEGERGAGAQGGGCLTNESPALADTSDAGGCASHVQGI